MPKSILSTTTLEIGGQEIPVNIYHERRRSIRFSIGRKAAILRLPTHLPTEQQQKEWERFKVWVEKQLLSKPGGEHAFGKSYSNGDTLVVGRRSYLINILETDNKTHAGKMLGKGIIELRLAKGSNGQQQKKATQHLLSRVVAQDFKPEITRRVAELNHLYFQKPINSVNLKYNRSNWGSCSTKGNINLSTCLLFAPDSVIDYVIIHELAHLVEMNHSSKFWALVDQAMPNYQEAEKWLKENWHHCAF